MKRLNFGEGVFVSNIYVECNNAWLNRIVCSRCVGSGVGSLMLWLADLVGFVPKPVVCTLTWR